MNSPVSVLSLNDLTHVELKSIIETAIDIKNKPEAYSDVLERKKFLLLFEKPSLRTRACFEIAIHLLGGHAIFFDQQNEKLGERESVADIAMNISCWADGIIARVDKHEVLEELKQYSRVPVVNALSDRFHPCQAVADFQSLRECGIEFSDMKLAYVGEGNNVCHSLMLSSAKLGAKLIVVTPKGFEPDADIMQQSMQIASETGGELVVSNQISDIKEPHAIYTDTWISMGSNNEKELIQEIFGPYQINKAVMSSTEANYFMHCQPVHRNMEVTDEVVDDKNSLVVSQAENRLYSHCAILTHLYQESNPSVKMK